MFSEVRRSFSKCSPVKIEKLEIPFDQRSILSRAKINPLSLDSDNNWVFYAEDVKETPNVAVAFWKAVHAPKESDPHNGIHYLMDNCFENFLRIKSSFEEKENACVQFSDELKADSVS